MPGSGETFNTIHRLGRLFQQYVVDMYAKIEFKQITVLEIQSQLHANLYQGLADAVVASDGQVDGSQLGKKVILPLSFTGGPQVPTSAVPRCNGYCTLLWKNQIPL